MNERTEWEEEFDKEFPFVTEEPYRRNLLKFLKETVEKAEKGGAERAVKFLEETFPTEDQSSSHMQVAPVHHIPFVVWERALEAAKKVTD